MEKKNSHHRHSCGVNFVIYRHNTAHSASALNIESYKSGWKVSITEEFNFLSSAHLDSQWVKWFVNVGLAVVGQIYLVSV